MNTLDCKSIYFLNNQEEDPLFCWSTLHKLLDAPYGRSAHLNLKWSDYAHKSYELSEHKSALLESKKNCESQLKKLKAKIKKLRKKELGPTQEIMLETWTQNKNKLKGQIDSIAAQI